MLHHRRDALRAADGAALHLRRWVPDGRPVVIIQVLHGLGEHAARYARFAAAAGERNYAVFAHDQRGHGEHADERGRFAAANGWLRIVEDVRTINDAIRAEYPQTPVVMLAHSMGCFVGQAYAMHHGGHLAGMILSASTRPSRIRLMLAAILAQVEAWRLGGSGHSALLDSLGFGGFNKPFEPARTPFDWLSRDEDEVNRYIADPLCGGPFTCSLWSDFVTGLLEVSKREATDRIPVDLPILITGGENDPVGGDGGMGRLALRFAETRHTRLTVKIYPGGRHEMLNDIVRDEVTADWLGWIAATTRTGH